MKMNLDGNVKPIRKPLVLELRTTHQLTTAILKWMNIFTCKGQGHEMYEFKMQNRLGFSHAL